MAVAFPFSAIVGQEEMKLALLATAVDPAIGGVLVFGDRGTGKSTAVRAMAGLLPPMQQVPGCPCRNWGRGSGPREDPKQRGVEIRAVVDIEVVVGTLGLQSGDIKRNVLVWGACWGRNLCKDS